MQKRGLMAFDPNIINCLRCDKSWQLCLFDFGAIQCVDQSFVLKVRVPNDNLNKLIVNKNYFYEEFKTNRSKDSFKFEERRTFIDKKTFETNLLLDKEIAQNQDKDTSGVYVDKEI